MTNRNLTPHGRIIEAARGKVSARQAAKAAGVSEGRWRQIVTGVQKAGRGIVLPVNPRTETLIAMAAAVGADIDAVLRAAGVDPIEADAALIEASTPASGITSYSNDDLLEEILRRMTTEESESDGNSAPSTQAGGSPVFTESIAEVLEPDPSQPDQPARRGRRKSPPPARG